ncbi:MAG: type IV pilus twitching motility protein PilT [Acidimicrobiia bacterium]|nr:type IV pilus twitching motility protein PilT [Acidimicrobiia bacterium]
MIAPMLRVMVQNNASDLHLSVGTPPRVRLDGQLRPLREQPCTAPELERGIVELLDESKRAEFEQHRRYDFSFGYEGSRFRGNVFYTKNHPAIALRYLAGMIPTPESLGLPPSVIQLADRPHGLVLVTGPTGSGKSTTIASLIDRINQARLCHIITMEDPIEYEFRHAQAIVNQREIGVDATSFADALRSALREDPDVVLVGEMRDLESIASALTIAETGHLVFATLHTNDAPQTIYRIIDMFPAEQQRQIRAQLSAALLAVVHQRLLPRRDGGRVAAFEVMIATEPVRNLIREGKTNQLKNVISQSAAEGMISLESYIVHLQNNGLV